MFNNDMDGIKRRQSSRAIKRPKFDDEIVESSLGSQNISQINKIRTRNPSLSTASDCSISLPSTPAAVQDAKKKLKSSNKKARRNKIQTVSTKNIGRWKPSDDLALIIGIQQTCDVASVHRGVKFSSKFTLGEIQERWYALLYDQTLSRLAQQSMRDLHSDQIQFIQSKALFSKAEEDVLGTVLSDSYPSMETFVMLLEESTNVFFPLRSAKSLMTHWQLLKHYHLLPDQVKNISSEKNQNLEFIDAEQSIIVSETVDNNEVMMGHEIEAVDRGSKKRLNSLEEQVSHWQVIVDSVTGISPPDFDNQTLAVLRGRLVRYLMRTKEISIGRNASGNVVDVDLSLEGPAWKISRKQAVIRLRNTDFVIINEGKRPLFVDGKPIHFGCKAKLLNNSVIEISSLRFIFLINPDFMSCNKTDSKISSKSH